VISVFRLWAAGKGIGSNAGSPIFGINAIDGSPLAEVESTGFTGTNAFHLLRPFPDDSRYAFGLADSLFRLRPIPIKSP
jgi:hypothetical protein